MEASAQQIPARLLAGLEVIDSALQDIPAEAGSWVPALAGACRSVWPGRPLYLCHSPADKQTCIIDDLGRERADWQPALLPLLSSADAGCDAHGISLPQALAIPEQVLVLQSIDFRGQKLGVLGLALAQNHASTELAGARDALVVCARYAAPRLFLAEVERERLRLRTELEAEAHLAAIGEMAGPIAHESNNYLNVVLLQVALMELDVSEAVRAQLQVIRRQGAGFQALVQEFHARRHRLPYAAQAVDLNRTIHAALAELRPRPAAVTLHLNDDLPPVAGSVTDIKRLIAFLVCCFAGEGHQGDVTLGTERRAEKAVLQLRSANPDGQRDPTGPAAESLEWAACKSLVRRLEGKLREETGAQGRGVTVEFKTYQ